MVERRQPNRMLLVAAQMLLPLRPSWWFYYSICLDDYGLVSSRRMDSFVQYDKEKPEKNNKAITLTSSLEIDPVSDVCVDFELQKHLLVKENTCRRKTV